MPCTCSVSTLMCLCQLPQQLHAVKVSVGHAGKEAGLEVVKIGLGLLLHLRPLFRFSKQKAVLANVFSTADLMTAELDKSLHGARKMLCFAGWHECPIEFSRQVSWHVDSEQAATLHWVAGIVSAGPMQ